MGLVGITITGADKMRTQQGDTQMVGMPQARYVARHPYVWPGGYEVIAVLHDGELLCSKCTRDNWREVVDETKYDGADQWKVVGIMTSDWMENYETCVHCGRMLDGYHDDDTTNPAEWGKNFPRILGESIDYSRRGQRALR